MLCDSPLSVRGARRRCLTGKGASLPRSGASETREIPASSPTVHGKTENACSPPDQQQLLLLEVNDMDGESNGVVILEKKMITRRRKRRYTIARMTEIGRIMFQHRGQRCSHLLLGWSLSAPRSATQIRDYCCLSSGLIDHIPSNNRPPGLIYVSR